MRRRNRPRLLAPLIAGAVAVAGAKSGHAQQPDSGPTVYQLDEIVVVAHRTPTLLRESAAATTVLTRSTIDALPVRTLPDVLRHVPGLVFVDRDGAGELSMAIARGFFGGGETEYVLVTIDGVPINDLRDGAVDWTQIPVASIERVEVLRGAGSTVYGDAAMGAVVNVVTRPASGLGGLAGEAAVGVWEDAAVSLAAGSPIGDGRLAMEGTVTRNSGYRSHSTSSDLSISGVYEHDGERTSAYIRANVQRIEKEDPGPLPEAMAAEDPRQSNPLYAGDERRRRHARLGMGIRRELGSGGQLGGDLRVEAVDIDETSTLLLAPGFGDTQLHEEDDRSLWARLQYGDQRGSTSIVGGVEGEHGGYTSRYFDPGDKSVALSEGDGRRTKLGAYAELQQRLARRWRLYAGLRFDALFVSEQFSDSHSRFDQWSPRVGVNFAYLTEESRAGNIYAAWTRAFKAPTLDQLYDVRGIPTGQPGEVINISNSELQPQRSSSWEVGFFQRLPLVADAVLAELALSVYRLDLEDEIDFDLSTFRYGNILESRHDGIELGLTVYVLPRLALTHSSTWMDVSFRGGPYEGNQLKNIPRTAMTNSARYLIAGSGEMTLTHRYASRVFLDDTNEAALAGGSTFDATVSWTFDRVRLRFTVVNLTDARVDRVGFLLFDPATFSDARYVYPAGGRYLQATVSVGS